MSSSRHFIVYSAFLNFYLLLCTVSSDSQKCGPGITTPGWTIPKGDIVVEYGSPLEIYCFLDLDNPTTRGLTAKDLIFKNASQRIDPKYVTVINDTTARLYIKNVTISNEMFYCKLVHDDNKIVTPPPASSLEASLSPTESSEMLICLNSVVVGVKPLEVTNFNCISYNWESLNCTWHQPNNGVKTNYTVSYQIPKRPGRSQWLWCPVHEEEKCTWTTETVPSYRRSFEYLTFLVEGSNKFGNISQQFRIHHYAHVIPNAPQHLTAAGKTPSSIYLKWNIGPLSIFEKGLIYRIKYTWNSSPIWNITLYNMKEVEKDGDWIKLNVTGLKYPNMPYEFKIAMKSAVAVGDDGWSPEASLVVKTKSCPPHQSPQTDIGSFNIFHTQSSNREILIYWKRIPDDEHNADDFRYEITVFEEDREINLKPVSVTSSYAKFINLSFNSYRFFIRAANSEGYAPSPTSVYVPRKRDVVPEPVLFTKVDFGDGVYELSWKLADTFDLQLITNFTVFLCEDNREWPHQCDSIVEWTHLPANTTKYNVTTKGSSGYQFALSVNTATSSSGMTWAMCTVLHNQVNKMKNVWVGKVGSTYIDLKWKLDCSERVEGIKGYNITYCAILDHNQTKCAISDYNQTKCAHPEITYLVYGDVTVAHGNITNLKPFTPYKISVAIFTDKLLGPPSETFLNCTKEDAPDIKNIKIDIFNITSNSAIVKWNPPDTSNGKIDHYEVHFNDETKEVNDTEIKLTGLSSYNFYSIRISACTAVCARTEQVSLHTKIGAPGEVVKPTTEKLNASQTKLKWQPPAMLAGPSPVYEVKVQYDEPDKNSTVEQFETTETEAILKLPCRPDTPHSAYTFYIRAKNIDDSDPKQIQYFAGPWSSAYTINCVHGGLNATWKILLGISFCVFFLSIFGFVGKKGIYKCQQMKRVEVVVPAKFTVPQIFPTELRDTAYHMGLKPWTDINEIDRFNTQVTDIDQASSIEDTDIDIDTDRETSRSGSGCYTN